MAPQFNAAEIYNGIYWGKACMDNPLNYYGYHPAINIIADASNAIAFGFTLNSSQTIASVLFLTGDYSYISMINAIVTGTIYIGDSTDYQSNEVCANVSDQGYYTCTKPISGKYIAFYGTGDFANGTQ